MPPKKYLALDDAGKKKEEITATAQSAGVGNAGDIVALDDDGKISETMLRESEVISREASEAIANNAVVNIFDDTSVAKARNADASAFATRAMGFAINGPYVATDQVEIIAEGKLGGFVGLTIGEPVFLSETPGAITQTPPTTSGAVWQKLGEATSATEIRIEIGEAICRA
jgi:hypothetical protein